MHNMMTSVVLSSAMKHNVTEDVDNQKKSFDRTRRDNTTHHLLLF